MTERSHCPEPQVLQAFVEGRLGANERRAVLAHLDECGDCMSAVDIANEILHEEVAGGRSGNRQPHWWLAAAAAVMIAIGGVAVWRLLAPSSHAPSIATLVAAAPHSARTVEPRIAGGFAWAAWVGPSRSGATAADEKSLELSGLAGAALSEAHRNKSAPAQHVAGVAMLLAGHSDSSLPLLEAATRRAPDDASAWNDLAAGQYAAAIASDQASRYPVALAAADHALAIDPHFAEAAFNRALILERLGLAGEARLAWQHYLELDPDSAWAKEAREHLAHIQAPTGAQRFEREQPRLEQSALAGDVAAVQQIVRANPERSRAYGEAEYLGRWAETHDDRNLMIARAIGDALAATTGESLLRDAVRAIDHADPQRRAMLAAAHAAYRSGRIAYSRHLPASAETQLRDAAVKFGDSPMARVARYYAACTRFDQADAPAARAELEQIELPPAYIALGAQVRWELALCHNAIDDWSGALPLLTDSAGAFRRLGEMSNLGFVETLLADTLAASGRPDESAAARIRSFELASADPRGDRLPQSILVAAISELSTGRRDAGRSLLAVAQSATNDDTLRADIAMQSALLEADDGELDAATRDATAANAAAQRLADPALRARATAQAQLASAAASLQARPEEARKLAGDAIEFFQAKGFAVHLPLAYLLRARAAMQLGAKDDAARDLDRGMSALEQHRLELTNDVTVADAAKHTFDDAIALALARGDRATAFAAMQHGDHVTIEQLQRRLGGTAVLALSLLPDRIVAFAITSRDVLVTQAPPVSPELLARAATLQDDRALRELYDALIRPAEPAIGGAQNLIVVPDSALDSVPFAALIDSASRPLVARMPVAIAPGIASLSQEPQTSRTRLAGIALPSGPSSASTALPETAQEVGEIASIYRGTPEILGTGATFADFVRAAARADVVHVAGHTRRMPGNDDNALLFGSGETVTWRRAASAALANHPIVMLSACETLRRPPSRQTRAQSLGAGFIAGGASEVVGTLAPISDRAARQLFGDVHRELLRGASAAAAVRNAQLQAIARNELPPAEWRAIAVLTTRID
jgi:hypothetical protein